MATSISLVQFCTLNGRQHWFWGSQQGQELEPGRGRLEGDRSAAPPCNCYHFVVTIVRIIIIIIIIKRGACRQHHLILEDHHQVKFLVIEEKNKISKPNPLASTCVWKQHFVWFGLVSDILEGINDERFAHRHQRAYDCNISFALFVLKITTQLRF